LTNDYYHGNVGRKVGDFFIGLGIVLIIMILLTPGLFVFSYLGLWIVLLILHFTKIFNHRRYIKVGMLCTLAVPLIVVGACFAGFWSVAAIVEVTNPSSGWDSLGYGFIGAIVAIIVIGIPLIVLFLRKQFRK